MEQTVTTTTTKGIVIALILIVIGIAVYFSGAEMNGPSKWISNIVFIGGVIWSVYNYGKQIDYNSTFGNYFAHGFKVAAVVTCIMIVYIIIFILLFPDFKEKAVEQARANMGKEGKLSSEQINHALELTRKFFMVFAIGGTLIGMLIFGSLAAVIGAAITKKEPRQLDEGFTQIRQ